MCAAVSVQQEFCKFYRDGILVAVITADGLAPVGKVEKIVLGLPYASSVRNSKVKMFRLNFAQNSKVFFFRFLDTTLINTMI